jgi:glycosyltransferase involved in cell wall biosynthesis
VIIPAFNAEAYIDEAVHSVLAQSYPKIEIIVVDDGSSDRTFERIAAYGSQVRYYRQQHSGGYPGVVRNVGMRISKGDYICFLDADDVMLPDRVQAQVEFLNSRKEVGLVFADYKNFSAAGSASQSHFQSCVRLSEELGGYPVLVLSGKNARKLFLMENLGIPSSLAIRRRVLDLVPGFPEEYRIGEDFHFYYMTLGHFGLGIIGEVLCLRRLHNSNVTRDALRTLHDHVASYTALQNDETEPEHIAMLAEKLYQAEMGLARVYANSGHYCRSVMHNGRAMVGALRQNPRKLMDGLRSLIRTAAIAGGLKIPTP